jgi:hypothetical protein
MVETDLTDIRLPTNFEAIGTILICPSCTKN